MTPRDAPVSPLYDLYDLFCDGCGGHIYAALDATFIRVGKLANPEASVYHFECAPNPPIPGAPTVVLLPGAEIALTTKDGKRHMWHRVDPV